MLDVLALHLGIHFCLKYRQVIYIVNVGKSIYYTKRLSLNYDCELTLALTLIVTYQPKVDNACLACCKLHSHTNRQREGNLYHVWLGDGNLKQ